VPCEAGLVLVEREFINITDVEHVPAVELSLSPLGSKVVRILRAAEIILNSPALSPSSLGKSLGLNPALRCIFCSPFV
jgi:hypothetical protein